MLSRSNLKRGKGIHTAKVRKLLKKPPALMTGIKPTSLVEERPVFSRILERCRL